jgi:hypothetical protein
MTNKPIITLREGIMALLLEDISIRAHQASTRLMSIIAQTEISGTWQKAIVIPRRPQSAWLARCCRPPVGGQAVPKSETMRRHKFDQSVSMTLAVWWIRVPFVPPAKRRCDDQPMRRAFELAYNAPPGSSQNQNLIILDRLADEYTPTFRQHHVWNPWTLATHRR